MYWIFYTVIWSVYTRADETFRSAGSDPKSLPNNASQPPFIPFRSTAHILFLSPLTYPSPHIHWEIYVCCGEETIFARCHGARITWQYSSQTIHLSTIHIQICTTFIYAHQIYIVFQKEKKSIHFLAVSTAPHRTVHITHSKDFVKYDFCTLLLSYNIISKRAMPTNLIAKFQHAINKCGVVVSFPLYMYIDMLWNFAFMT